MKSSSINSSETSAKYSWPRSAQKEAIHVSGSPELEEDISPEDEGSSREELASESVEGDPREADRRMSSKRARREGSSVKGSGVGEPRVSYLMEHLFVGFRATSTASLLIYFHKASLLKQRVIVSADSAATKMRSLEVVLIKRVASSGL